MTENNSDLTKDLNLEIPEAKQISEKINQGKLHKTCERTVNTESYILQERRGKHGIFK